MIPDLIEVLLAGHHDEIALEEGLHAMMRGELGDAEIAGLLVALRSRPLQARELAAMARVLRLHRVAVSPQVRPLIDTCGTGGDGAGSFNISTTAALVVAGCGGAVAKHGNRAASSKTGSADVLEALGLRLDASPEEAARLLDATGFAFLFAPAYHPSMAHVMPARRALGIRTCFNLLGPLSNPALAEYQLLGVYDPGLTRVLAEALRELGTRGALVVHCAGLDELGLHDVTVGHRVRNGEIEEFAFDPRKLGLQRAPVSALRGGHATRNAEITTRILEGQAGPPSDVVALNAAAALMIADLAPDLAAGLECARAALRDGSAARVLERVVSTAPLRTLESSR